MSKLSQEQKTKLNNFLRSLNQRITNFIEELVAEDQGVVGENKKQAQIEELNQLLSDLQQPAPERKPMNDRKGERREQRREGDRSSGNRPQNNSHSGAPVQSESASENQSHANPPLNPSPTASENTDQNPSPSNDNPDYNNIVSLLDRVQQRQSS